MNGKFIALSYLDHFDFHVKFFKYDLFDIEERERVAYEFVCWCCFIKLNPIRLNTNGILMITVEKSIIFIPKIFSFIFIYRMWRLCGTIADLPQRHTHTRVCVCECTRQTTKHLFLFPSIATICSPRCNYYYYCCCYYNSFFFFVWVLCVCVRFCSSSKKCLHRWFDSWLLLYASGVIVSSFNIRIFSHM